MINKHPGLNGVTPPPPDLIKQMADDAGVTPGQLLGRPELVAAPESDLLTQAKQRLPEASPELTRVRLAAAIEDAPYSEWFELETTIGGRPWPAILDYAAAIKQQLGEATSEDLEQWWNTELEEWLNYINSLNDQDLTLSSKYVASLFSALLAEYMQASDHVVITIPTSGPLFDEMGKGLKTGILEINGDVGSDFGDYASGNAKIILNGNADQCAGANLTDKVEMIINGDVGNYAGFRSSGDSSIIVTGRCGFEYGMAMDGRAVLKIGNSFAEDEPGKVAADFAGTVTIAGEKIIMPRSR